MSRLSLLVVVLALLALSVSALSIRHMQVEADGELDEPFVGSTPAAEGDIPESPEAMEARLEAAAAAITFEPFEEEAVVASDDFSAPLVGTSGGALSGSGTPTPAPPANIKAIIVAAATRVGVNVNTMLAMCRQESNFRVAVRASTSSAAGLFQFTSGTWADSVRAYGRQYGFGAGDRLNPAKNAIAACLLARDSARAIGSDAAGDLYLAHFLGQGGARTLLRANGNAQAAGLSGMAPAARANKTVFYKNNGRGAAKTVNEIKAWARDLMARPMTGVRA